MRLRIELLRLRKPIVKAFERRPTFLTGRHSQFEYLSTK